MSKLADPTKFWGGVAFAILGAVLVYFGADFNNTNMKTYVDPQLVGGALVIIGFASFGIGLITMLLGLMKARR